MQYMLTASPRSACYLWVVLNSKTCQEFLIELVVKLLSTLVGYQDVEQVHVHEDL